MMCYICGKPATTLCDTCKRPVCLKHHCDETQDIWYTLCRVCFERSQQAAWDSILLPRPPRSLFEPSKRFQPAQGFPSPKRFQSAQPQKDPARPPFALKRLWQSPPAASRIALSHDQPISSSPSRHHRLTIDRGFISRWVFANLAIIIFATLIALSIQANQLFGVLLFGGMLLKLLWAIVTAESLQWLLDETRHHLQERQKNRSASAPSSEAPHINRELQSLLGQPIEAASALLGAPEHIDDLSLRDGALPVLTIYNWQYFSKGIRLYMFEEPVIRSVHFIQQGYEAYQSYPHEIVPGIRVGMTRQDIEAIIGQPEADEMDDTEEKTWRSYKGDFLPPLVRVMEIFYEDPFSPSAPARIISLSSWYGEDSP